MKTAHLVLALFITLSSLSASAAVVVRLPLDDLVTNSTLVVRGTVLSGESFLDEVTGKIMTRHAFRVEETLKGERQETVSIVTLGGELGDLGQIVPGEARLLPGEEMVLCLKKGPDGYAVTGMSQGAFRVFRLEEGWKIRRDLGGLFFVGENNGKLTFFKGESGVVPRGKQIEELPYETFRELVRRNGK